MSYNIKGKPWDYKGAVNVEDCKTSEEVMYSAGLDWQVSKCKLVAKMPLHQDKAENDGFIFGSNNYVDCPNAFATYRTDYNIPLGIVKDRYTPIQNIEAFNFFNNAIGKNKAIWQTAGFFGRGERIFVSAKLPQNIYVNGDPIENYLVFTTSHDGSSGVKILFTPIRIVCQNTLNAAINSATNYISFRHTKSIYNNLDTAHEILGICKTRTVVLQEKFIEMSKKSFKDKDAYNIFGNIIFNDNELLRIKNTGHTIEEIILRNWKAIDDSQISMKKVNTISEINNYYFSGIGQKEHIGTGYGIYNAVNGYYSNVDNSEGTKRMDSLLYGDKSRKIELAGNLVLAA